MYLDFQTYREKASWCAESEMRRNVVHNRYEIRTPRRPDAGGTSGIFWKASFIVAFHHFVMIRSLVLYPSPCVRNRRNRL